MNPTTRSKLKASTASTKLHTRVGQGRGTVGTLTGLKASHEAHCAHVPGIYEWGGSREYGAPSPSSPSARSSLISAYASSLPSSTDKTLEQQQKTLCPGSTLIIVGDFMHYLDKGILSKTSKACLDEDQETGIDRFGDPRRKIHKMQGVQRGVEGAGVV